jgi:hypothetical protein
MKFECHCGQLLIDQTDDLSCKGHFQSDQTWNALWDEIETRVIGRLADRKLTFEMAAMQLRQTFGDATRVAYQCPACGRLYLNDRHGTLHCYVPQDKATSKQILQAQPDA